MKDITLNFEYPNSVTGTLTIKAHDYKEAMEFLGYIVDQTLAGIEYEERHQQEAHHE